MANSFFYNEGHMEITGVDTVQTLQKVGSKEPIQPARVEEDKVKISSEAEKRAEWVKKIHQLPDIRPEKIAAAVAHPSPSLAALVEKMLDS